MRVRVNGIDLGYDVQGEGTRSIVLLHAFPLQRGMWAEQAHDLSRRLHARVVTPDFRGFGESEVVSGVSTMEQLAADVHGLVEALRLDDIVLGGLSMGGYVAFAYLRQFPERVQALILADTRATADTAEGRAAREASARYAEQHGVAALFDRDAERLFGAVARNEHPEVVARARAMAAANSAEGVAAASRGMALRPDVTDQLPEIGCPTLVIVGEQDALTPVANARQMFERIPTAQLEIIPDAGHLSNLERPDLFGDLVARFLHDL